MPNRVAEALLPTSTASVGRWLLPLLHYFQREVQQFPLALFSPLDHLQDGDGSAQVPAQLQHLLIRCLVVLSVLEV